MKNNLEKSFFDVDHVIAIHDDLSPAFRREAGFLNCRREYNEMPEIGHEIWEIRICSFFDTFFEVSVYFIFRNNALFKWSRSHFVPNSFTLLEENTVLILNS